MPRLYSLRVRRMETHCLHAPHTQDLVRGLGNALKRYIVVTRLRRPLQANELFFWARWSVAIVWVEARAVEYCSE